jgi:hypothetical protein
LGAGAPRLPRKIRGQISFIFYAIYHIFIIVKCYIVSMLH